jgi:WD40 repeat protein
VAFSPDGSMLASGSSEEIRLWSIKTGESLLTLTGHSGSVQCVAFSPDGSVLASGSAEGEIRLWSTKTGKPVRRLTEQKGWVTSVAFYRHGELGMNEEGHRSFGKLTRELSEAGFALHVEGNSLTVSWSGYKG